MKNTNYDLIGDIHGHADELVALLESMDYQINEQGYYQHPQRTVIYVGDFVDRGKQQKAVINIVRPMIENGSALAVMGNHEFNAISYHMLHPETKEPLRSHTKKHQHQAFLNEYTDQDEIDELMQWFKTLPLFLELDEIRVIHACWNDEAIAAIQHELDDNNCLTDAFLVKANTKGSMEYDAIETLLKGLELSLPQGAGFKDSYGKERFRIRVKWWQAESNTYKNLAIVPKKDLDAVPNIPAPIEELGDFIYKQLHRQYSVATIG
jgi:predicted MPP superfamily phosphohydrolase